ncbi:hypothetical protein ACQP25_18550 [Microtetraspora malaysiensis]|uniref:hypothetical protein n=1 Tax=Microtetraspora malaysiensis TaxID=161358 RepID=UPI003D8A7766
MSVKPDQAHPMWTELYDENDHYAAAGDGQVITGRIHRGDENGSTTYQYSTVTLDS